MFIYVVIISCKITYNSHATTKKFVYVLILLRLDFDRFTIAGPERINNVCNQDQFIVSGGNPVPAICGFNQGSHS